MTTITNLNGLAAVSLDDLHPSPNSPRQNLTEIDELAGSIRENGLIQPIVAQKIPGQSGYQILAGHRRHAACKRLGMAKVPVIIRRDMLPDEELLAMLVENGQRANLDPIEEARALSLLRSQGFSQKEIGRKIGRTQTHVSARLALLSLPVEEQEEVRARLVGVTAAVQKARVEGGTNRPRKHPSKSPVHLGPLHALASRAKARCQRMHAKSGRIKGVGGVACGECWESVIRADERQHLNDVSNQRGRCVLCDTDQPAERSAS